MVNPNPPSSPSPPNSPAAPGSPTTPTTAPAHPAHRNENLDFLRATAIVMVLVFHTLQRWPTQYPVIRMFTDFGSLGVNLFFVLSGWLIGGLYWRELAKFKNVEIGRFITRRALRTMPPYFVALLISWLGVRHSRGEPFHWQYVFFIQNFLTEIPYFRISWSLCVEEHFYFVMPWVMLFISPQKPRASWALFGLSLLPLVFRSWTPVPPQGSAFGYAHAATHLNIEGLILGVWAAYLHQFDFVAWNRLQRLARYAWIPTLILVVLVTNMHEPWKYALRSSVVAFAFLMLLVRFVDAKPILPHGHKLIYAIAVSSYSMYLIHSVALDVAFRVLEKLQRYPEPLLALVVIAILACAGGAYYWLIEAPTMALRGKLMPVRSKTV